MAIETLKQSLNGSVGGEFSNGQANGNNGNKKDFHVSIIGGGIGGLSAAIGLLRNNVPVDVFEAASQFGEIGAGISFGKNARTSLEWLGLKDAFEQQATTVPSGVYFEWRDGEGDEQKRFATTQCPPHGNSSVHRAKFLDTMIQHVPKSVSHFGKRLKNIKRLPNGSQRLVRLLFDDETTFDTDVVIGYDGIHSKVRPYVLDQPAVNAAAEDQQTRMQWSGTWAYRGLIPTKRFVEALGGQDSPTAKLYSTTPQMFVGKDTHILIFPIDQYETINLVAFYTDRTLWPNRPSLPPNEPWTQQTTKEEMLSKFPDWGKDVRKMLECIDQPSKWALHQLISPPMTYVRENVCIAGDAAHGGTPHQGALAGQAMEDAVFLTWLLSQQSVCKANVQRALQVYDRVRRPRANQVLKTSLEAGDVYEFASSLKDDRQKIKEDVEHRWNWIWEWTPEADFIKARKELESVL